MKSILSTALSTLLLGGAIGGSALAGERTASYDVTITNLTRGTLFTPVVVTSHAPGAGLFELGQAASASLAMLAEGGDTLPWQTDLAAAGKLYDAAATAGGIPPGGSATVTVAATRRFGHISLAGMLLPTNDGFVAVQDVRAPRRGQTLTLYSPGYDAGSEANDEICLNIPGPHCGGAGYSPDPGEGVVHIHAGIHGGADLDAAERDWRNPVARVVIRRVGGGHDD